MVKWEYLEVSIGSTMVPNPVPPPSKVQKFSGSARCNGEVEKIPEETAKKWIYSAELVANHFGKDGWELIKMRQSHNNELRTHGKWFFFKRQN